MTSGLARSVQTRLVRHAHALQVDPNLVLARYATERLLFRLSRSPYAERFVLKGALMLLVWVGETIRPTRDADLLGIGPLDVESLREIILQICAQEVEPDGLEFDVTTLRVAPIRVEDAYGGQRVTLVARLGAARLRVQVDVGIGDAVFPPPEWISYPALLDMSPPRIRAYQPETAIAEKLHAMVELGSNNSRMRDFFDIRALASARDFQGALLARAIMSTFARRGTPVPDEIPLALTPDFAQRDGKHAQWRAFMRRLPGTSAPLDFATVIDEAAAFASPVLLAQGRGEAFEKTWPQGGPWQ